MTDHADFLQAILAAPDDDTPRLIFADWLDEQGEAERAEFIRVQCEVARSPAFPLFTDLREVSIERTQSRTEEEWGLVPPSLFLSGMTETDPRPLAGWDRPGEIGTLMRLKPFRLEMGDRYVPKAALVHCEPRGRGTFWVRFSILPLLPEEEKEEARAQGLRVREKDLLAHQPAPHFEEISNYVLRLDWSTASISPPSGSRIIEYTYRRGFIDEVRADAQGFFAHADVLTAALPICAVEFTTRPQFQHRITNFNGHEDRLVGRKKWYGSQSLAGLAPVDGTPILIRELLTAEFPTIRSFKMPPFVRPDDRGWQRVHETMPHDVRNSDDLRAAEEAGMADAANAEWRWFEHVSKRPHA